MLDKQNQNLPVQFDPQVLAERNHALFGRVPIATMLRLNNVAVSIQSDVEVELYFSQSNSGYCKINGKLVCILNLRCERCLDEFEVCLKPTVKLILRQEHTEYLGQTEGYDLYEYSGKSIKLKELVEDELLLALPLAPKHKEISLCNQDMVAWLATCHRPEDKIRNPFAKLRY